MKRFFQPVNKNASSSMSSPTTNVDEEEECRPNKITRTSIVLDLSSLPSDPGLRPQIADYEPKDQDTIRRAYLQKGPCQPAHNFPKRQIGDRKCQFQSKWFDEFKNWLEYNIDKDAAFCLPCYLFRPKSKKGGTSEAFLVDGFSNWRHKQRLNDHIGLHDSIHNEEVFVKQSSQERIDYRLRLTASLDVVRLLLRQGVAFRGHDEAEGSRNRGKFLELLQFLAEHNESIENVVLGNAPKNLKLTSPDIQKDLVYSCAIETVDAIINDLSEDVFAVLIDEARDTSIKEQMAIVLRYVNKKGCVIERFVGIVHVPNTAATSLRTSLKCFFAKHGLSFTRLRGQGYDGASNMQGKFNGLKTLILNENSSAFFVHCFAHQLQLALIQVTKGIDDIGSFFLTVSNAGNLISVSSKRRDNFRYKEANRVFNELESGVLLSGQGLNQELGLNRPGDTRWGSHYRTLVNLIITFPSVIEVLEDVLEDGPGSDQKAEARNLLKSMLSFEFDFTLHLMMKVLGITNELSLALQRKDQDIVNSMKLVQVSKDCLQEMRDSGWDSLLNDVSSFCMKHDIVVEKMDAKFIAIGKSMRMAQEMTNLHHYQRDVFYECIDRQRAELDNRFNEVNIELLICMSSLNPADRFSSFKKKKLVRLADFYPNDFTEQERLLLRNQLCIYKRDMKSNEDFWGLNGIADLAKKMVEKGKNNIYNLVYRIVNLALVLPVATATVERAFSAMNIVKNRLRNHMGDEWMNDCLVTYIEKDVFKSIENEAIMVRFQQMKPRRGQL